MLLPILQRILLHILDAAWTLLLYIGVALLIGTGLAVGGLALLSLIPS